MKKILLSSVALLGFTVGAFAADLPSRRMAPAPMISAVPMFTWTGFYVGVQAGYAWGEGETVFDTGADFFDFDGDDENDGFVGGAHVGFNYQFGSLVAGIEADIEGAGLEGDGSIDFDDGTTLSASSEINFQGSLRARVGFAFDRALIYATGGLAFANIENSYVLSTTATGVVVGSQDFDETEWGWTLGAGVEYAFTNNLTARVEYRYTQFDGFRNDVSDLFADAGADVEPDFHTVRVGLSYKF